MRPFALARKEVPGRPGQGRRRGVEQVEAGLEVGREEEEEEVQRQQVEALLWQEGCRFRFRFCCSCSAAASVLWAMAGVRLETAPLHPTPPLEQIGQNPGRSSEWSLVCRSYSVWPPSLGLLPLAYSNHYGCQPLGLSPRPCCGPWTSCEEIGPPTKSLVP